MMQNDPTSEIRILAAPAGDSLEGQTGRAFANIANAEEAAAAGRLDDVTAYLAAALELANAPARDSKKGDAACQGLLKNAIADLAAGDGVNAVERIQKLSMDFYHRRMELFNPGGVML